MALTERLAIKIDADGQGAVKEVGKVGDSVEDLDKKQGKLAAGMKKWGPAAAVAGAGLVAGIAPVGVELYKLGADLEQMDAKAKTVFGDQKGLVDAWAKSNANAMGLTRREATGLATNMADLLVPMGMTREQAAKMSTEVIGLSGALSAWSGGQKSASEVAEILQGAMLGEYDALKSLGIGLGAADVEARLAANGQDKLTGAARQQAEALAVQQLILEKSTDAQKAFGDGVQSTNEKMAEQAAKFREAKEALATTLTPAINAAVIELNDFVVAGTQATETSGGLQGAAYKLGAAWADTTADIKETNGALGKLLDLQEKVNKLNPTYQAGKAIGGLFGRASGGPVNAGQAYIVGERGPEVFVPGSSGSILPSLGRAGGSGAWGTTTIVNHITVTSVDPNAVVAAIKKYEQANGQRWRQ